jgi:hypothetical protein
VEIVARNVKFHSSQDRTSQSIATNVSQTINHKAEEALVAEEAMVAEEALAAEEALVAEEALTEDREKCTKQLVVTVARNAKFHSSHQETSRSTAANAFKVIEEIKKIILV